jgi:hypothetical protein
MVTPAGCAIKKQSARLSAKEPRSSAQVSYSDDGFRPARSSTMIVTAGGAPSAHGLACRLIDVDAQAVLIRGARLSNFPVPAFWQCTAIDRVSTLLP